MSEEIQECPFVLEDQPFIELKVRAYKTFDEKTGKGVIFIRNSDVSSMISEQDTDTGEATKLGEISAGLGHVVLDDEREDIVFAITHKDLWIAFQEALGKG